MDDCDTAVQERFEDRVTRRIADPAWTPRTRRDIANPIWNEVVDSDFEDADRMDSDLELEDLRRKHQKQEKVEAQARVRFISMEEDLREDEWTDVVEREDAEPWLDQMRKRRSWFYGSERDVFISLAGFLGLSNRIWGIQSCGGKTRLESRTYGIFVNVAFRFSLSLGKPKISQTLNIHHRLA